MAVPPLPHLSVPRSQIPMAAASSLHAAAPAATPCAGLASTPGTRRPDSCFSRELDSLMCLCAYALSALFCRSGDERTRGDRGEAGSGPRQAGCAFGGCVSLPWSRFLALPTAGVLNFTVLLCRRRWMRLPTWRPLSLTGKNFEFFSPMMIHWYVTISKLRWWFTIHAITINHEVLRCTPSHCGDWLICNCHALCYAPVWAWLGLRNFTVLCLMWLPLHSCLTLAVINKIIGHTFN
jgi:hypothetical protein